MKNWKKQAAAGLLLLTMLLSGCGNRVEETLNRAEKELNALEERLNTFFEETGKDLEDWVNNWQVPGLIPTDEPKGSAESLPETYVSQAMETAFLELPLNYGFSFDANGETEILNLLNAYRQANGLQPLVLRDDLSQSARYKSLAMLQYDYFSHDNPNLQGKPFDALLWNKLNLKYTSIGENLAFISTSGSKNTTRAEELFNQWKNSPAHNEQMLNPYYTAVGIGVVRSTSSGPYYKNYKVLLGTQHFGN